MNREGISVVLFFPYITYNFHQEHFFYVCYHLIRVLSFSSIIFTARTISAIMNAVLTNNGISSAMINSF